MEEFGSIIKKERIKRGLSITDLSKITGIDIKTISFIERGIRKKPNIDTLVKLLDALECYDSKIIQSVGYTDEEVIEYICNNYKYTFEIKIKGHGKTFAPTDDEAKILINEDLHEFLKIRNMTGNNCDIKCDDCTVDIKITKDE